MKTRIKYSLFRQLSIKQRLPLLICTLLLVSIIIYGFANYFSLKKATLIIGKERLASLTGQLNSLFGVTALGYISAANTVAASNAAVQYLKSDGKEDGKETLAELDELKRDSTWVLVQLLNKDSIAVLRADKSTADINVNLKNVLTSLQMPPGSTKIGKLYRTGSQACYPVVSAVTDKKNIVGYIVAWKSMLITAKAVDQFAKFVGTGEIFFVANADGSLWTDFIKPLPDVPFKIKSLPAIVEYTNADGGGMIADIQVLPHTGMVMGIAVSARTMLKGVTSFVSWIIIIGVALIIIGIIAARVMSSNITAPLSELTEAVTALSQGNYSSFVPAEKYGNDELGKLAIAFNTMAMQVDKMHHELENKVIERTLQLENVNKELEAFSYSVSHDLRTPLRAINGYSVMLKEDYGETIDDEGNRILRNIMTNAKMMGQLIDDLLAFSRLGKKELVRKNIDMHQLATNAVNELLSHEPGSKYQVSIQALPPAMADEVMIKQVFINIIGNAIKYSSKKSSPAIEIGFKQEGEKVIYYVKDNGAGFDMAYAGKLFGVFQRLHSQEEFEGTGVGLALVKRIIDKHKGEIWAEGHEGEGAAFYFSLPNDQLYE